MIKLSPNMIGRTLKVHCFGGIIHEGVCSSYIQALDNEPEVESISIGENEIFINEIESIKTVSADRT